MSKIQIWEYVLKWGRAQNPELPSDPTNFSREDFNTLKNSLQQIIPFIGFYNITSEEFSDKVLPYKKILPKELYKDLLKYFLKPNNQKSGPCGDETKSVNNSKYQETERSSGRNFLKKDNESDASGSRILINQLALIITFEYHRLGRPNLDTCHSKGYHPITRHFGDLGIDGNNAFQFVYDSIMNCWANSWKIALVVSINPMKNVRELYNFLKEIRKKFGSEILDIIFVQPVQPSNPTGYFSHLDVYVVKDDKITWKQEFNNVMDKIITKAYSRNKYGGDEILFYNEDEPYHEFSNFYKAQITIGHKEWPTIEHYFQAAKFRDRHLHNKIPLSRSARKALQKNNYKKHKDWESPTLPDDKESIMKNVLFQKFTQHEKLKYKLLSTGKVKIFNHTENDRYWGDGGGRNHDGLNRLGIMLQELREIIMEEEKSNLINKYNSNSFIKWVVPELGELRQFDDLIDFIDFENFKI
ncbi:hypothetical protein C1645_391540 [Glomus cerebriforme]|uniref:NADAR domain-containing protein n=1 Tax=Glomus cerebriforme TaxID=658196 RepID=A0A397SFL6_9GLOM|nr:hypothetical protein C1645_391540 [Glomus cerebriforme]